MKFFALVDGSDKATILYCRKLFLVGQFLVRHQLLQLTMHHSEHSSSEKIPTLTSSYNASGILNLLNNPFCLQNTRDVNNISQQTPHNKMMVDLLCDFHSRWSPRNLGNPGTWQNRDFCKLKEECRKMKN